ncbi:hypothetical protein [Synechococcus sp. PCC 7336]|uniref:hypothetical protein n=1 Tax=Synechococcus sp. PCC 7336 TaxID=195250 RepID=UPI0003460155|nr:hypothetical protein [Synechococcus sp. PCC 7336]
MLHRFKPSSWGWGLAILLAFSPAAAHQVEVAEDVGATLHVEPNDAPRARDSNRIWFALTRRGGRVLPLSECDCTLWIYQHPYRAGDAAIATPDLQPIDAEGYTGIPSAQVAFPQAGAYRLVLAGKPKGTVDFQPFELNFDITVVGR